MKLSPHRQLASANAERHLRATRLKEDCTSYHQLVHRSVQGPSFPALRHQVLNNFYLPISETLLTLLCTACRILVTACYALQSDRIKDDNMSGCISTYPSNAFLGLFLLPAVLPYGSGGPSRVVLF